MPKRLSDKSQTYFWGADWQEAEREAEADIEAGRIEEAQSVQELIALLRRPTGLERGERDQGPKGRV